MSKQPLYIPCEEDLEGDIKKYNEEWKMDIDAGKDDGEGYPLTVKKYLKMSVKCIKKLKLSGCQIIPPTQVDSLQYTSYEDTLLCGQGFPPSKWRELELMKPQKLIIAGGRNFNDYERLQRTCWVNQFTTIISGGATGADTLGIKLAHEKGCKVIKIEAEWGKYGKAAGPIRNQKMAAIADKCICFWDGKSKGTKSMIDICKKKGIPCQVELY
jgi:hypothetical protein